MATLVGWQYLHVLIRDVSGEYHIIHQSIFSDFYQKQKEIKTTLISFKKFCFCQNLPSLFAGKSIKQFYRFTGKFSVKAQPYL
jgi:hypothetical protein